MTGLGIVIVTYNSRSVIGNCLAACLPWEVPVVVVDNASQDGTADRVRALLESGGPLALRHVRLVANPENKGFAAACNQGIRLLDTETVLLLNPDAEPLSGLEAMRDALRRPGVALAGGRLLGVDGRDQRGFAIRRLPSAAVLIAEVLGWNRLWPGNPWNESYRCVHRDLTVAGPAEQPAGAFLLLRRDVWQELGGLDERFHPLWFEDVDYCRRARDAGYTGAYVPEAVARHQGAHSATQLSTGERPVYWYGSLLQYAIKHYSPGGRAGVAAAVWLTALLRIVKGVVWDRSLVVVHAYRRVGRLAIQAFAGTGSNARKVITPRPGKPGETSVV